MILEGIRNLGGFEHPKTSPPSVRHCHFIICFKYQPEDDPYRVEIYGWLVYYFYEVLFLTVGYLPLFIEPLLAYQEVVMSRKGGIDT